MTRLILAAMLLLPSAVGATREDDVRGPVENYRLARDPDLGCNAGGPTSLAAAAIVAGLLARRRR